MVLATIVICEVAFWVLLGAGLVARYLLRMRRLSTVLLVSVPVVDVVLLVVTVIDLRGGATAHFTHGLAAAYIGFSIAFGHSMMRWADQRFAHRYGDGPAPWRPPRGGWARVRYEWREWGKALIAVAISCALLGGGVLLVGDSSRTGELTEWMLRLVTVAGIWFVAGPLAQTLFPGRPKEDVSR